MAATWSVIACALIQCFVDASFTNLISVVTVSMLSIVTFYFVIRGNVIRSLPLPALIVIGFNISTMSGALIAQTFALRSLTYNLQVPHITFTLCALFQVSLLVTLYIFLATSATKQLSHSINLHIFHRAGVMQSPTPAQLWIMGFMGSSALLVTGSSNYDGSIEYGDILGKFIVGLSYLAFAPFIIPILNKIFQDSANSYSSKQFNWALLGYLALLIIIAILRNSRGTFMLGIANLGLAAMLLMALGQLSITAKLRRRLMIVAATSVMLVPLASDLAIAMVLVRGERTEVAGAELVKLTIDAFNDNAALERYRKSQEEIKGNGNYDEIYLSNPFIARFVTTKFFDNTLSYEDVRSGDHANELWSITINKIGALLPTPLLGYLNIDIDKKDIEYSIGDALYNLNSGIGLGGYRTGSPIGHGMGLMGPIMFLVAIPLFLLLFIAVQSLTRISGSFITISPVILLQLMPVYSMAAGDSLNAPIDFMLRTLPQSILIYWMIFHITRLATSFWGRKFKPMINIKTREQP